MTVRCRGCNETITEENDSEAHIIPNALGGRLAPRGIICRMCNSVLDKLADNALVEAFGAWPTLLDIPRDRGNNPRKTIETREGHKVQLDPDGSLKRMDIDYDILQIPEGHLVQISAGNMKTFRQLLKRAAKDFPQFDPVAAEQYANTVEVPSGEIRMSLDFSPAAVFGGVITAIWLYLLMKENHAFMDWNRLLSCVESMQRNGGTFRYFVDGLPGLLGPNIDLCHKLIVRSIPCTGELIAYVEILGILRIGGLFARSQTPGCELEHIYAYDLVQKADLSSDYSIDSSVFERQNWLSVGLGPTDADLLRDHFKNALDILTNHYRRRFST
jgi:hypothetical protein